MDLFARIESAAHDGAHGLNAYPEATDGQKAAGNYRKGRVLVHGLTIAIETPRNSYRTGIAANGERWSTRAAAHYGHFLGTKGADGDQIDVFVGPMPESRFAWVINQVDQKSQAFDEHKCMLGFPDEDSARKAYLFSYERGWRGLGSMVRCTLEQFKWWIKNGNHKRPLTAESLPYDGTNDMEKKVAWDSAAEPVGMDLAGVIYLARRSDPDGLMFDRVTVADILEDADGEVALDALVVPVAKLERKMQQLQAIMNGAGGAVSIASMQITPPFKQRGTTNIATVFELSDGQTVTIYLHNPDTTPNKLAPADELISWKWMLNKKDVTILVAPERGEDLNPREVGRRIMKLAERNSARFTQANKDRAARLASIETLKNDVAAKEAELGSLTQEIEVLAVKVEEKRSRKPAPTESQDPSLANIADARKSRHIQTAMAISADPKAMALNQRTGKELGVTLLILQGRYSEALSSLNDPAYSGGKSRDALIAEYRALVAQPGLMESLPALAVDAQSLVMASDYEAARKRLNALAPNAQTPSSNGQDAGAVAATTEGSGNPAGLSDTEMVVLIATAAYKPFARIENASMETRTKRFAGVADGITEQEFNSARDSLNASGKYLKRSAITEAGSALVKAFHPEKFTDAKLREFAGKFAKAAAQAAAPADFDPTAPANYEAVMADEAMQLKYQDALDSFFGQRLIDVRNALRELGWAGEQGGALSKDGHALSPVFKQVGAGRNVVNIAYEITGVPGFFMSDRLELTAAELAAKIDLGLTSYQAQSAKEVAAPALTWRDKFYAQKQEDGTYRVASNKNFNPLSQRYGTEAEAEAAAEAFFNGASDFPPPAELAPVAPVAPVGSAGVAAVAVAEPTPAADGEKPSPTDAELEAAARAGAEVSRISRNLADPSTKDMVPVAYLTDGKDISIALWTEADWKRAVEAVQEAEYQTAFAPFDWSQVKMPTAVQLGAKLRAGANTTMVRLQEGGAGWTNGHLLDLNQMPNFVKKVVTDVFGDAGLSVVSAGNWDRVIATAKAGASVPVEPIATYDDEFIKPLSISGSGVNIRADKQQKVPVNAFVLTNKDSGLAVMIDKRYFGYFAKTYKGCEFLAPTDGQGAMVVKKGGEIVGVVMPINQNDMAKTLKRASGVTTRTVSYEQAKANADAARERSKVAGDALNQFPKGPMGLTPDDVRATPEWQAAKKEFDEAFDAERAANNFLLSTFPKEVRADRDAERAAKMAAMAPVADPVSEAASAAPINDLAAGQAAIKKLSPFLAGSQRKVMKSAMSGEEGQFFIDKAVEMANVIATMPKTYEQDGKGDQAIAYLHYFRGGADWYITERDMEGEGTEQAFGLADMGVGYPEIGYISIAEIVSAGAELDLHWEPQTLGKIKGDKRARVDNPMVQDAPWTLSPDEVKALTDEQFKAISQALTDANGHPEELMFRAKRFGTPEQIAEAESLLVDQHTAGELTTELKVRRDALEQALAGNAPEQQPAAGGDPIADLKGKILAAYQQSAGQKGMSAGLERTAEKMYQALIDRNAVALSELLYKTNRVSRAAFEQIFSLKLPATIKGTHAVVNEIIGRLAGAVAEAAMEPATIQPAPQPEPTPEIENPEPPATTTSAEPPPQPADDAQAQQAAAEDAETNEAKSFMQAVIDGTADMMNPDLADRLATIHERFSADADMLAMFNAAAKAYSGWMVAEAKKALA